MRLERRKMQEREKRKITAILVLVAFMMTLFPTGVFAASDVTSLIQDLMDQGFGEIKLLQDGLPIVDDIDITKPITLNFDLRVPVQGDRYEPDDTGGLGVAAPIVEKGDFANFTLSNDPSLLFTEVTNHPLNVAGEPLVAAHLTITNTGDLNIDFNNGDDLVFSGDREKVYLKFEAEFIYEIDASNTVDKEETVTILGKTFKFTVPKVPIVTEVEKKV